MVISYSYMVLKKSRYNVPSEIRMHDTKLRRKTENRIHNSVRPGPRTLDSDLKSGSKSMDSEWSWKKLPFILEMEGQIHDDEIGKAQSKINSALQSSLQAGFSLFETNLETDQLQHRRYILASSGDEAKARAATVSSLEVGSEHTHFQSGFRTAV